MPRSNRPRGSRRGAGEDEAPSLDRILAGSRRTEARRDGDWTVQPIAAASAVKTYRCPGCGGTIEPGTAHRVVWRSDGILGDAIELEARRHWHTHCWRIRP